MTMKKYSDMGPIYSKGNKGLAPQYNKEIDTLH